MGTGRWESLSGFIRLLRVNRLPVEYVTLYLVYYRTDGAGMKFSFFMAGFISTCSNPIRGIFFWRIRDRCRG